MYKLIILTLVVLLGACASTGPVDSERAHLEQLLARDPHNPELHHQLGYHHYQQALIHFQPDPKAFERADYHLRQTLSYAPGNPSTLGLLYNLHYRNAIVRGADAQPALRELFEQAPESLRSQLNPPAMAEYLALKLRSFYTGSEQPEAQREALTRAISEQPQSAPAYLALASLHQEQGRHNLALAVLRQGTDALPDSADLARALAKAYVERASAQGCRYDHPADLEQAANHLQRALSLQPDNSDYRYDLSEALLALNRQQLAWHQAELLLTQAPTAGHLAHAIKVRAFAGQAAHVRALIEQLDSAGRQNFHGVYRESLLFIGDWSAAAREYRQFLHTTAEVNIYDQILAQIAHDLAGEPLPAPRPVASASAWERQLWAYWQHQQDEASLAALATSSCARMELHFAAGYRAYRAGDRVTARTRLEAALQEPAYNFTEYPIAQQLLRQL